MKVIKVAICDSYYDVKVNYKIVLSKEMHECKPPTAPWNVLGRILDKGCGNTFGKLYNFGALGLRLGFGQTKHNKLDVVYLVNSTTWTLTTMEIASYHNHEQFLWLVLACCVLMLRVCMQLRF